MQKVCRVAGGVKAYLAQPDCLVTEEHRACPFCGHPHRLRLHGWYERFVIPPGVATFFKIAVCRLLCARTGRTVSLLPDFCLPRRQHAPGVLGLFLQALSKGDELLSALKKARPDAPEHHSISQSLLKGFLSRSDRILAYLAALRPRVLEPPAEVPSHLRHLRTLVLGLLEGFPCVIQAFEHHARLFHEEFHVGLA